MSRNDIWVIRNSDVITRSVPYPWQTASAMKTVRCSWRLWKKELVSEPKLAIPFVKQKLRTLRQSCLLWLFTSPASTGSILSLHWAGSKCKSYHRYVIYFGNIVLGRATEKSLNLQQLQRDEQPCYHHNHHHCYWRHQHEHKPPQERQKPVSGCTGLCVFVYFSEGGEQRGGRYGKNLLSFPSSHSHTHTHTRELQGVQAANPLARTPAAREATGETGKKR